jgi:hypothetical protein
VRLSPRTGNAPVKRISGQMTKPEDPELVGTHALLDIYTKDVQSFMSLLL